MIRELIEAFLKQHCRIADDSIDYNDAVELAKNHELIKYNDTLYWVNPVNYADFSWDDILLRELLVGTYNILP